MYSGGDKAIADRLNRTCKSKYILSYAIDHKRELIGTPIPLSTVDQASKDHCDDPKQFTDFNDATLSRQHVNFPKSSEVAVGFNSKTISTVIW